MEAHICSECSRRGRNKSGQVGVGNEDDHNCSQIVTLPEDQKVVQVSCGWRHTIARTDAGNVLSWDRETNGQLSHGDAIDGSSSKCVETVDALSRLLIRARIPCLQYHRDISAEQRMQFLAAFQEAGGVLVCTDAAARGLDIPKLGMLSRQNLHHLQLTFLHRVGRTGRAGNEGVVTSMYTKSNQPLVTAVRESVSAGEPVVKAFSRRRILDLKHVVFDEADMLLSGGFANGVRQLIDMFKLEERRVSESLDLDNAASIEDCQPWINFQPVEADSENSKVEDVLDSLETSNIIGRGNSGSAYKATMPSGEILAVKAYGCLQGLNLFLGCLWK